LGFYNFGSSFPYPFCLKWLKACFFSFLHGTVILQWVPVASCGASRFRRSRLVGSSIVQSFFLILTVAFGEGAAVAMTQGVHSSGWRERSLHSIAKRRLRCTKSGTPFYLRTLRSNTFNEGRLCDGLACPIAEERPCDSYNKNLNTNARQQVDKLVPCGSAESLGMSGFWGDSWEAL